MVADSSINSRQLRKELEKKQPARIYLFLGEEEAEKNELADAVTRLVHTDEAERKNAVRRFSLESAEDLMAAASHALSSSLFSGRTTCIMKNIHALKHTKDNRALMRDIITQLPDTATLIMTAEKYQVPAVIGPGEAALIKVVKFWRPYDSDLAGRVREGLKKSGMSIEQDALELLLELAGRDMGKINDALESLKYCGVKGAVTAGTVSSLLSGGADASLFEFISSLFKREERSLKTLGLLLDGGTPELVILSNITRRAEMVESYHLHLSRGMSPDEALKKCGVFAKEVDNFRAATGIYTAGKISGLFPLLARADLELKSGGAGKNILSNPLFSLAANMVLGMK